MTPEEEKAFDQEFSLSVPDKGGELPADGKTGERKVAKRVKGTRSRIANTVGIVVLGALSFLAADNVRAQSAPPTGNRPAATASATTGEKAKETRINPWEINTLLDGTQAKIVKMKDGR
jgi:hypothetical protein